MRLLLGTDLLLPTKNQLSRGEGPEIPLGAVSAELFAATVATIAPLGEQGMYFETGLLGGL